MKWFTHKTVAIAGALALDASAQGIIGVMIGSIFPDLADTTLSFGNKSRWRRLHRQSSHWIGWYFLLLAIGILYNPSNLLQLPTETTHILSELTLWIGFGGVTHILLDALTPMGVPIWPLGGKQRIGFNFIKTGSVEELLFLFFMLSIIAFQCEQVKQILYLLLHNLHVV